MAARELSLDQILETVRQWPEPQRKKLLEQIEALPRAEQAHAVAQSLNEQYKMGRERQKRMSELLGKGNAGTITAEEKQELDLLVTEFEEKALELAQAVAAAVGPPPDRPG